MEPKRKKASIPCFSDTRDEFREFGKKGETWDALLKRVMNKLKKGEWKGE